MAKTDKSPKKGKPTTASPDKLLKTDKEDRIELSEEELEKVSGGYDSAGTHKFS